VGSLLAAEELAAAIWMMAWLAGQKKACVALVLAVHQYERGTEL